MDCLINEENRTWNHEIIDRIFAPEEGELIKKIPLAKKAGADSVLWPMMEDGQFTSKRGYRFLKEEKAGLALGVLPEGVTDLWKKLWALDIPNKVQHSMWRACKNSLPTKCNLFRRQLILDHRCDRCMASPKNILHAIWSCSELDVVWESVG